MDTSVRTTSLELRGIGGVFGGASADAGSLLLLSALDEAVASGALDDVRSAVDLGSGNGLLTAEGDEWLRHRRLTSGAFHRERVADYGRTMARYAEDAVDAWHADEAVDVALEVEVNACSRCHRGCGHS